MAAANSENSRNLLAC